MKNRKCKFEIRELDCYLYEDEWTVNTSYFHGFFETSAKDEKRAFSRALAKIGFRFKLNRTLIEFDGDFYVIVDRKTKEPLFVAIPCF